MELILWRHAEAEDLAASDMARNLTAHGREQASRMAAWLRHQWGNSVDDWSVLASPANRAQQTAAALNLQIITLPDLRPDVSADSVLDASGWKQSPGADRKVIVVGHQPTLGMVAARLINGDDGAVSIKKGAVWWFGTRERLGQQQIVLKAMVTPESISLP